MKIRFRFRARSLLHPSSNANLTLQLHPVNDKGGPRIGRQLTAFAALIVGKKNETVLIETLQENDANRWSAIGCGSSEADRVCIRQRGINGRRKPGRELLNRILMHIWRTQFPRFIFEP